MNIKREIIFGLMELLLRPLVRFCIRHSLRVQDLLESAKTVFLDIAQDEISKTGETATASRLSVITGIHRRDISRLSSPGQERRGGADLITKIIGQWQSDPRFTTKKNEPRILRHSAERDEFSELVRSVSKELNPATILFELERVGTVQRTDRGVQLVLQSYTPRGDLAASFGILADDTDDLIQGVEENVIAEASPPNLHIRTSYDNVRPDAVPEIRRWLLSEGHAFHARARDFISRHDQDINPQADFQGKGEKVVLGSYSRVISEAVPRQKLSDDSKQ